MSAITTLPATAQRWSDLRTVFGVRGEPSWCNCQYFVDPEWNRGAECNRESLKHQVEEWDPAPGLLAYRDDEPVGWVQVGPLSRFPRLTRRRAPATGDWAVTCFVVRPTARRQGVSAALLEGAIAHARTQGGLVLRARTTDAAAGARPGSDLFTGVLSTFLAAGFTEVSRNQSRVTVELSLT